MPPAGACGVTFVKIPNWGNRLSRVFGVPGLLARLVRQDADLYHFQDPDLLPIGFVLKLLLRKRVLYDAYEDFPSAAANKRWIPRPLRPVAAKVITLLENAAARCFDAVITADPHTLRRFAKCGKSKKLVFYNFPNLDFFPAPSPHSSSFDIVYRGGLSERTGTLVLLEALRLLSRAQRPVRTLLIGYFDDSRSESEFRQQLRKFGLEKSVEIRGYIEHERMANELGEARIGICPLLAVPKFLNNIPVKVFEYWACAMPVIATDLPPIRPFLRHEYAGLLVPPNNARALANAIRRLLDCPPEAERMGRRGRTLIANRLNNSNEILKLQKFFGGLLSGQKLVNRAAVSHAQAREFRHA